MIRRLLHVDKQISKLAKQYAPELVGVPLSGFVIVFAVLLAFGVSPIIDKYSDEVCLYPPWPVAIATGALLCALKNWDGPNPSSLFTWVLPAVYFLAVLGSDRASPTSVYAWQGWRDMLAHKCVGEDCFGPALACVPLVFSLSYSVTAGFLSFIKRKPVNPEDKMRGTNGMDVA
jgi:hypothetical protein